jgi:hypothetical protein
LCNNPKIDFEKKDGVRKYKFKPLYNLKKGIDLINLIKENQFKAAGGVLLDDVQESLPNADAVIKVKFKKSQKKFPKGTSHNI